MIGRTTVIMEEAGSFVVVELALDQVDWRAAHINVSTDASHPEYRPGRTNLAVSGEVVAEPVRCHDWAEAMAALRAMRLGR